MIIPKSNLNHVLHINIIPSQSTAYPHTSTWCSSLGTTKAGKLSGAKEARRKSIRILRDSDREVI